MDFKSFVANGFLLSKHLTRQGWMNYFEILNGPTYPHLVKHFWVRAEVCDEFAAHTEERKSISNNEILKWKTRVDMGLKEFEGTWIRSAVTGIDISIIQDNIAQLIGVKNVGIVKLNSKDGTKFASEVKENLFENQKDYVKVKNLHLQFKILFKIISRCLIPMEGRSYHISWDHKHFLWFMRRKSSSFIIYASQSMTLRIKIKRSFQCAILLYEIFHHYILI